MTQYVFMNEEIRKANPKRPVIVNQTWDGNQRESNAFEIWVGGKYVGLVQFDPETLKECTTHSVKAWVEFLDEVELKPVQVVNLTPEEAAMLDDQYPNSPLAVPKEPDKPVVIGPGFDHETDHPAVAASKR
jgi:hypothetical protein